MNTPIALPELESFDLNVVAGVYLLSMRGVLHYIGSSNDISHRVRRHRREAVFAFDSIRIIRVESPEERAALERDLIIEHNPPYNYVNTDRSRELRGVRDAFNHPRSVRWTGDNYERAKKLAAQERRPLNQWLNVVVERLWDAHGEDL